MTEKQFFASKWKPFEVMTVFIKQLNTNCECILVGIDFEERTMKVRPIDIYSYQEGVYEVKINIVSRGKVKKMKVLK